MGEWANWKGHMSFDSFSSKKFRIRVEPTVSDNYPAVFRQMRAKEAKYLFIGKYEGQGATSEQFEALFRSAGLTVVYKHTVDDKLTARNSNDQKT